MAGTSSLSARAIAAQVLRQFDPERAYAGPILNRLLHRTSERQRATDLVFGSIRNLNAIDEVIAAFSGRRIERINKVFLAVIRVGVYELVYSPDSPPYSIVNEAVNTAKQLGGRKQTGFVNAVLRQVVRHITQRRTPLSGAEAARTLVQDSESGCSFDIDLLPDPDPDLAGYLSTSFSLPLWLVEEWLEAFGPERTREVCFGCNRRPSVYARVNSLKTDTAALVARLTEADVQVEVVPSEASIDPAGEMLKIAAPQSVVQLPGFAEGWFTVQDLAASRAVRLLDPQPGWTILDLCAAPGTKTTQLAERTQDAARIVATDIDAKRLPRLHENLDRLGTPSVTVVPYTELETEAPGPFDAVLLDVPCSNTGVLAKRIEARFRLTRGSVKELTTIQRGLLDKVANVVKPGGRIAYSTCSIQASENGDLIRAFLNAGAPFDLIGEELALPSAGQFDHDGAYTAILLRRES